MPSARLWIVATPIGNIDDLSPRARQVLQEADLILAEDTRRTGLLLEMAGIGHGRLLSFHDHNEEKRQPEALAALSGGAQVALVTDAGTPLLSDPGYRLVRECHRQGIDVSPVPGPSAPVVALSAAGIPPVPFAFLGFLPRGAGACRELFGRFSQIPASIVFFERRNRLPASLRIAHEVLGNREMAICRELTKTHEEIITGNLATWENTGENLLGEITVIIGPPAVAGKMEEKEVKELLLDCLSRGLKPREAARETCWRAVGWSASELYDLLNELKNSGM